MLNKYSDVTPSKESKIAPSPSVIQNILNYSKSVEVKKAKKNKILIHLN